MPRLKVHDDAYVHADVYARASIPYASNHDWLCTCVCARAC